MPFRLGFSAVGGMKNKSLSCVQSNGPTKEGY